MKFFRDGSLAFDAGHVRDEKAIIDFMQDPKEAPPPPPPEKPWAEEKTDVVHLNANNFESVLKEKEHA